MTQAEFNQMLSTAVAQGIVGGTYVSQYDGEEIDGALKRFSNKNLLDNAYWASRDAIINQRGKTEYTLTTSEQYVFDRWKAACSSGTIVVSLTEKGLSFPLRGIFSQTLDIINDIKGKTVTLSALYNEKLITSTFIWDHTAPYTVLCTDTGGVRLAYNGSKNYIQIYHYHSDTNYTLKAAKLELGDYQTLAHRDASDNWAQNDPPPNKALELAKCQRYQYVLRSTSDWSFVASGVGRVDGKRIYFVFNLPVEMRINPTIHYNNISKFWCYNGAGMNGTTGISIIPSANSSFPYMGNYRFIGLAMDFSSAVVISACPYLLSIQNGGEIIFDANL